jgi:hypothetical protein
MKSFLLGLSLSLSLSVLGAAASARAAVKYLEDIYVTRAPRSGLTITGSVFVSIGLAGAVSGIPILALGLKSRAFCMTTPCFESGGRLEVSAGAATIGATGVVFLIPGIIMTAVGRYNEQRATVVRRTWRRVPLERPLADGEPAVVRTYHDVDLDAEHDAQEREALSLLSRDEKLKRSALGKKLMITGGTLMGIGLASLVVGPLLLTSGSRPAGTAGIALLSVGLAVAAPPGIILFAIGLRTYRKYERLLYPGLFSAAREPAIGLSPYFTSDGAGLSAMGRF